MKTKIVIGSILAVFILMMLPSISAVEFNTVTESNKAQIIEQIKNMDIEELKEKLKENNNGGFLYLLVILLQILAAVTSSIGMIIIPAIIAVIFYILFSIFGFSG